jgi:hypothetical protein
MEAKRFYDKQYPNLHRFFVGLNFACVCLVLIGGMIGGSRLWVIALSVAIVFAILSYASRVLMKTWATWDETTHGAAPVKVKKK